MQPLERIVNVPNRRIACSTLSRVEPHATHRATPSHRVLPVLQYPLTGRTSCNRSHGQAHATLQGSCSTLSRVEPHATCSFEGLCPRDAQRDFLTEQEEGNWRRAVEMWLVVRKLVNVSLSKQGGPTSSMTHASVTIQVNPTSVPSTPSCMGEVAAVAQVLTPVGRLECDPGSRAIRSRTLWAVRHDGFRGGASRLCHQWRTHPPVF